MWISTATGSTAAMRNAGGRVMNVRSRSLQYLVREHLAEPGQEHLRATGHGMIGNNDTRVPTRRNCVYMLYN